MMSRCYNPDHHAYPRYGGRGIKVCSQWHDFNSFHKSVGYPPKEMSLDRINNDGDYSPENCRWATSSEQALNRRMKNKNGLPGIYKRGSGWRVIIKIHQRAISLGQTNCLFDAYCLRKSAENRYH